MKVIHVVMVESRDHDVPLMAWADEAGARAQAELEEGTVVDLVLVEGDQAPACGRRALAS